MLNSNYKPKSQKYQCVVLYLLVGEPTRLTPGSTWESWVLGGPGKKLIRIKIRKKFLT